MDLNLKNKVIIVTGGAKGIGAGIAEVLAAEGAIVAIVGRSEADNVKTVEKITAANGTAFSVVAELTEPEDCRKAVETVVQRLGRIDGLVNNAGVNDGVSEKGNYTDFMALLHRNLVALLPHGASRPATSQNLERRHC